MRHGGVLSSEGQVLLLKPHMDAPVRKTKDHLSQIIQLAGQAIYRMTNDRVAFTNVAGQLYPLRSVEVLAGSLVHESFIECDFLELPQLLLIERAHAQTSEALASLTLASCLFWTFNFRHPVSHSRKATYVKRNSVNTGHVTQG